MTTKDRMKRIAILSTSYFPNIWNGQGRATFSTAYMLASKGHEVSVFTYTPKGHNFVQQDGQVSVHYIGNLSDKKENATSLPFEHIAEWNRKLIGIIQDKEYDTIVLMNNPGWQCAKSYRALHLDTQIISFVPFLYTFTGWLQPLTLELEKEIKHREAEFIAESDVLIAHTEKFGRKLATYCNRELYVIPNCHLDLSASKIFINKPNKIKGQMCFVGRANREKSLERIIRVMPNLGNTTLIVASPKSSPEYQATLMSLAKKLDVEHRIEFIGWKPTKEIRELYRSSCLAIVPSQFEPFGYAALDPMSLGTPVIVSEWSCLEEYVNNKDNVFSSIITLESKIAACLSLSDTQKENNAEVNKEMVSTFFGVDYISKQLEPLFHQDSSLVETNNGFSNYTG